MRRLHLYTLAIVFVAISAAAQTYDGSIELVAVKAAASSNYWTWGTSDTAHYGSFYNTINIRFTLENADSDPRSTSISKVYAYGEQTFPSTYSVCRSGTNYCVTYQNPLPPNLTMMISGTGPLSFFGRAIASWQTAPLCNGCPAGKVSIQTTTPVYSNNVYTTMPIGPPPPTSAY